MNWSRATLILAFVFAVALVSTSLGAGILAPVDTSLPPLRVTDHLVDVKIVDGIAVTEITQRFRNDTGRRLEATYLFPLPEQADLTNFEMSFNGKMVQGEVLPADQAAREYEAIVRQMRDPGLIEFIGRRLLKMRIFPIEPNSETTIKMQYQQICRRISDMQAYHYPLRTRRTAGQAYGTVRFNVRLESGAPLKNIWSPSHAVEIVRGRDETSALIAYEAAGGSLEDDFLLLYDTDSQDLGLNVVASGDVSQPEGGGHFVLMLAPKQLWPAEDVEPQDVVFILDTSGSMAGEKIEQARRALQYCVDQLDERDRFNVVRFSTGFDLLHESPKPATAERRKAAKAWIQSFKASGGTNIADTLGAVLDMKAQRTEDNRPFVTVFLTDGRGNREPEEILNTLREHGEDQTTLRIFPFGVGHDVNTRLLDGLASDFTGRPTYVQPGEDLELVLGGFFDVVARPVLTNLRLTLPDAGITERFPATLGDLYHGQQLVIAGRFARATEGAVRLTAQRSGQTVEYVWPSVAFTSEPKATYVEKVWAGRKIAYLINQIRSHGESSELIEEIIRLGREHGIQTPYSSWFVNPGNDVRLTRRRPTPPPRRPPGAVRRVAGSEASRQPPPGGQAPPGSGGGIGMSGGGSGGGMGGGVRIRGFSADEVDLSVETGEVATKVAAAAEAMRKSTSADASRIDARRSMFVKFGTSMYVRIGSFLADETIDDETEILVVRFVSEAWFELVRGRPDLRDALAAQSRVVVRLDGKHAILVSEERGIEAFSDDNREQLPLVVRSSK